MEDNRPEEIDLLYFFKKLNDFFKRIAINIFKALGFIRRNWIILLVLILAGVGYGYYVNSNTLPSKKAKILLRINFDSVNYVYSLVESFNESVGDGSLETEDGELYRISSVEIKPVINFRDILDKYEEDDRRLEMLLRNIEYEFEDDDEFSQLPETFRSEYKYHFLEIFVNGSGSQKTITSFLNYINSNPILRQVKESSVKSLQDQIAINEQTIEQINAVIDKYRADNDQTSSSSSPLYIVDNNLNISNIFESKLKLISELETLRRDAVYANEVVVNVNKPQLYRNLGLTSNKMTYYPVLFVCIFFGLALLRSFYFYLKRTAAESEA